MRQAVVEQLLQISEIKNVSRVSGQFDFLARLESNNFDRINRVIIWKLKKMTCVRNIVVVPNHI